MKKTGLAKSATRLVLTSLFLVLSVTAFAGAYQKFAGANSAGSELIGTEWIAVDVVDTKFVTESNSTLKFSEDGRVQGSAGCNNYSGGVTLDGDQVSFTELATTRKMCDRAIMEAEQGFLAALEKTRSLSRDDEYLRFLDADGDEVIKFRQLAANL
jgi:putative lipoprotein